MVSGIRRIADGLIEEFKRVLPGQRKTQRDKLALLVATMLEVKSANAMELAAGLLLGSRSAPTCATSGFRGF